MSKITFGKVDGSKNERLANKFWVYRYPTLKLFVYGKLIEYQGENISEDWTGPAATELKTAVDAEEFLDANEVGFCLINLYI